MNNNATCNAPVPFQIIDGGKESLGAAQGKENIGLTQTIHRDAIAIFNKSSSLSGSVKDTTKKNLESGVLLTENSDIKSHNRELTKQTFIQEEEKLLAERMKLVRKNFDKGLTRQEEKSLKYIDWKLDRIDDAKHGEDLDRLESDVQKRTELADLLRQFTQQVEIIKPKPSKHRRGWSH